MKRFCDLQLEERGHMHITHFGVPGSSYLGKVPVSRQFHKIYHPL